MLQMAFLAVPVDKLSNSDFYVTAATVIPVVFLALVLEGGLLAWIAGKINEDRPATLATRTFISLLQTFAVLILLAGTVSEILALHVLLQQRTSAVTQDIVFYSTALLITLLGFVLATKIPGIFYVSSRDLSLALEDNEELCWSGVCLRLTLSPIPWIVGKLFLTDRRLVWKTPKQLGLGAAPDVEIRSGELAINQYMHAKVSSLAKLLPANTLFPSLPRGYFFAVATSYKKTYRFCVMGKDKDISEYLDALIDTPATDNET
jgi:hypothetical protein